MIEVNRCIDDIITSEILTDVLVPPRDFYPISPLGIRSTCLDRFRLTPRLPGSNFSRTRPFFGTFLGLFFIFTKKFDIISNPS